MRYEDLQPRKDLHIKLFRDTHKAFRIAAFNHGLSMQEIIEEFAILVAEEDSRATKIINNLKRKKVDKEISRISKTDSDTIYDIISSEG